MIRIGICLPLLLLFAGVQQAQEEVAAPDPETEAVRSVFQAYKQALVDGDGEAATALVDVGTLSYFEDIQDLALNGSEEEVKARAFVDRLLIVTMRHELEPEVLASMDLEGLLRHAIDAGWIAKASILQLNIGEISIDGNEATGIALTGGAIAAPENPDVEPLSYSFVREDGAWKFRFGSLVASLNRVITEFAQQLGANEDDLIFTLVAALSGREVLPAIWSAPGTPEGEPAEQSTVENQ